MKWKWNRISWIKNNEISYKRYKYEIFEINRNILKNNNKFEIKEVITRWHKNNNLDQDIDVCFSVVFFTKKNYDPSVDFDLVEYKNFMVKSIERVQNKFTVCGNFIDIR